LLQLAAFETRCVDAGLLANFACGLRGLATNSPPQFGQTPPSFCSVQSVQNVHSNEQIRASVLLGGKSRSQHSQLGLS